MKEIKYNGLDPDRNKCPESLCVWEEKADKDTSATWKQCKRCGRIKDLSYNV